MTPHSAREENSLAAHYFSVPDTPAKRMDGAKGNADDVPNQKNPKNMPSLAERNGQEPSFSQCAHPLASASVVSIATVLWLQPLISLGAQKILDQQDVWAVAPADACDALHERFADHCAVPAKSVAGIPRIAIALAKTFRRELAVIFSSYLLYAVAMVIQPFVLQAILDYMNGTPDIFGIENGYALVALMAVVSLLGMTGINYGFFTSARTGVKFRSLMISVVYEKALRISSVARQSYTTGEIVTMMSVDAERIYHMVTNGPWLFVAPPVFSVTVVLIALLFDVVSAICGGVLLVTIMTLSVRLAGYIGKVQAELLGVVEERVRVTSEALQGIRVMKFYAWEEALASRVQSLRAREIQLYRKLHSMQILNVVMLYVTPVYFGGIVLGLHVGLRGDVTVTEVYTLIALVNISRYVINMFPAAIGSISQGTVAMNRIDDYLQSGEIDKSKMVDDVSTFPGSVVGSIVVRDARFEWSLPSALIDPVTVPVPTHTSIDGQVLGAPYQQGFTLDSVNLEIDAGSLVMIIGSVGAGKSSLLSALLGEMVISHGSTYVHGSVSYVDQDAWIRNCTVKDNIIFEAEFDSTRYAHVLQATQLDVDMQTLPGGDKTEIGERGMNLSGGQKARVAIARAMYRRNYDILMLDDPLSAVDPHVAHAIFEQCIVGLAREKTRLLVLNSHYDLLVHADKVLVVQNGHIVGDGTYQDVLAQFPDLQAHVKDLDNLEQDVVDEHNGDDHEVVVVPVGQQRIGSEALEGYAPRADGVAKGSDDGRLVQDEDRVKGKVGGEVYKAYFDETGFNGVVVVIGILLVFGVGQAFRVMVDWWQGHWARNMSRDGVDPSYSATRFGMWYLGFILVSSVLIVVRGLVLIECCIRSSTHLHDELFRRVLNAPVNRYFDITPVGRILNRFSNDLDQMDSILPDSYHQLLQSLAISVGSLAVCAATSYWIGLSYLPVIVVFVITGLYFKKTSREVKRLEAITRTPVFSLFSETLNGMQTIRAFKMQNIFKTLNRKAVDTNAAFYLTYWSTGRWLAVRLDLLSVVVIVVVSLHLVIARDEVSSVMAGISLTYSLMLTSIMQWVVRCMDMTDNSMTSVERLMHFRTIPSEEDGAEIVPVETDSWPSSGHITFENLSLRYRPELPLVLRDVNLSIGAGEKVGICGRTGAGKSSLMIALFRICNFASGTIFIDGIDISKVKLRNLRRSLAIIPQDPVLFSGSIRENLDPSGDYSDNRIWSILKQVHLIDAITAWGAGLDFVVSENGDNLSVGQRQLLCIGRALLKNSKIVVLDEATANVDTATDVLIQGTIKETFKTQTVLIIAHRINTIMHCDKIAVMEAGHVAEFGAPKDLLQHSDSIFASLAARSVALTNLQV